MEWYVDLAYDPLIYKASDGSLRPRLAQSWHYVGADNTVFDIQLRSGVKFSDGSPLTADVVRANIEYYRQAGGASAAYLASVRSVAVLGPLTVRLTLSQANPLLPQVFTQDYQAGNVISGQALRQPAKLATRTFGAGPYVLDTAETVPNGHYTYRPNPNYWDKSALHYDKVVVKALPNPNTALAALKTGQVDVIQGEYGTAAAAKSAGLHVVAAPHVFSGLAFADRTGQLVRALGDVRVRQAFNYAVDRQKLAKGLFGQYGTPTETIVLPGQDGSSTSSIYTYDPPKARQLLAQAGYPNGLTLPVLAYTTSSAVAQAMADELKAVGVRLQITVDSDGTKYLQDMASGKYPIYAINYGSQPVYLMGPGLFLPAAAQFNPLRTTDAEIESLYDQAAAADAATRGRLDQQIITRLDQQAWFVPAAFNPVFFFARPTVVGVRATAGRPSTDPAEWQPA